MPERAGETCDLRLVAKEPGGSAVTEAPPLVLMVPGAVLLLLLERFLRAEYLAFLGQL